MKQAFIYGLLACLIGMNMLQAFVDRAVYFGSIQFPTNLIFVPSIRIWHEGVKVPVEVDHDQDKVSFEVSVERDRRSFYLVITDQLDFDVQDNTVKCFRVIPGTSYHIYFLELAKRDVGGTMQLVWVVHRLKIPVTRIPDDAVIVYCPADYVQEVVGTSSIEFPKIVLKNDLVELAGSPEKLCDVFNRLQLQAINYDTVHDSVRREIKIDQSLKTVIAMNVS